MSRSTRRGSRAPRPARPGQNRSWKLEDAKARFSEVVRLARSAGPQRVTVRGQDAVVVVCAKEFAALTPSVRQPSLHAVLSNSPLRHLEFGADGRPMPVRDVPL